MTNRTLRFRALRRPKTGPIRTARGHLCPCKPACSLRCEPVWSIDRYASHRELVRRYRRCATGGRSDPPIVGCGVRTNAPLSVADAIRRSGGVPSGCNDHQGQSCLGDLHPVGLLNFLCDSWRLAVSGEVARIRHSPTSVRRRSERESRVSHYGTAVWSLGRGNPGAKRGATSTVASLASKLTASGRQGP